jgi:hypothetical protein
MSAHLRVERVAPLTALLIPTPRPVPSPVPIPMSLNPFHDNTSGGTHRMTTHASPPHQVAVRRDARSTNPNVTVRKRSGAARVVLQIGCRQLTQSTKPDFSGVEQICCTTPSLICVSTNEGVNVHGDL